MTQLPLQDQKDNVNMSGPTERDPLLPSYEASQNSTDNPSNIIYTIRATPPTAQPTVIQSDAGTSLPPNDEPQGWVRRRWVRRSTTFGVGKVVLAVLVIALLVQPLFWFWTRTGHNGPTPPRKTPPTETLQPLPGCPPLQWTQRLSFTFNKLQDFTLKEHASHSGYSTSKHIGGRVIVSRGPIDQTATIEASIAYGSSEYDAMNNVAIATSDSSLTIDASRPDRSTGLQNYYSCLSVEIHLFVSPDTKLAALRIYLENIGIDFQEDLSLSVNGVTDVTALSGNINCDESKTFSSRETIINVASGSITGNWALLDLLSITAQSGDVNVGVYPGEASRSRPAPANLIVHSQSGGCHITTSQTNLPDRDYRTEVISQSGGIGGVFVHGSRTYLKSSSGSIRAEITPHDGDIQGSSLVTEAHSGGTTVTVHEPYQHDAIFSHMQSRHSSASGSLQLHYPKQWEGTIEGNVLSGGLEVSGRDVKIIEQNKIGSMRRVKAVRGRGNSYLSFDSASGSARIDLA